MEKVVQSIKEEEFIKDLCNKHAFNINLLEDLFELQMKGFNNVQIAQKLGIHRITVQRYANTLRKLPESEFKSLYNYVLLEKDDN